MIKITPEIISIYFIITFFFSSIVMFNYIGKKLFNNVFIELINIPTLPEPKLFKRISNED